MTEHPHVDFSDPAVTIRTGTSNPYTLYAHGPGLPERGKPIGFANTINYAQGVVAKANGENPPTQWAYDQACKALEQHRKRADDAQAHIAALYEKCDANEREGYGCVLLQDIRGLLAGEGA